MSFTDPPEQILDYPTWRVDLPRAGRRELRPLEGRRHGKGLVVRFEGIDERNAAIALGRLDVWVERRELPALKKGEYYRADLVGFEVVNLQGQRARSCGSFSGHAGERRDGGGRRARALAAAGAGSGFPGRPRTRSHHGGLGSGLLDADRSRHAVPGIDRGGPGRRDRRTGAGRGTARGRHGEPAEPRAAAAPQRGRPAVRRRARHGAPAGADRSGDTRRGGEAAAGRADDRAVGAGSRGSRRARRGDWRRCRRSDWWPGATRASTSACRTP